MSGRVLGIIAAGLLAAVAAEAAPLNWEGTVTTVAGSLPPIPVSGGGVATLNGSSDPIPAHLATLRLKGSRGNIAGTETHLVTDPEVAGNGIAAIIVQGALQTGTLAPISGGAQSTSVLTQAVLPVGGVAKVCLLSTTCSEFIPLLLTQATPMGGIEGVGVGGLITGQAGAIRISLEAAPWTIHTASAVDQTDDNTGLAAFHAVTAMGFAHGPVSGTTSTAQPSGVLQVVTPIQVRTNLPLGSSAKVAILGELLVHFIPEPGLLVLVASGVAGLALLGHKRVR